MYFINDFVHSVASFFSKVVCVVKQNYDNGNLEFEPLMLKMR